MIERICTCDLCGKPFVSNWTEEEAMQEYRNTFGWTNDIDVNNQGLARVCDDCYDLFMIWHQDNINKTNKNN